ncbi:MAG TPA: M67 family metallopeptidase [Acidimicrobiales bacterium]|nr:M67 family metallopeptidase [Acidimicrobiales bacterium]
MLEIPRDCYFALVAHALDGLPDEACGLIVGRYGSDLVDRFVPLRNAAASSKIYEIDPADWAVAEDAADREKLAILGVVHSHTHSSAYPSPTDVRLAAMTDPFGVLRYLIVSLKHPEPSLRSFRIVDKSITEEPITLRV